MATLQIYLKPSNTYLLIMLFILGGALVSIFCSLLPYYIQLLLAAAALVYGGWLIWGQVLLKGKRAIVALVYQEGNHWLLKERSGKNSPASLCGDSLRLGWVCALRFKGQGAAWGEKFSSLVFYDAVEPKSYRRLLMSLGAIKIRPLNEDDLGN